MHAPAAMTVAALLVSSVSCIARADASPIHDWSGPYIGGQIGYAWGKSGNQWRSPGAGYYDWQPDGDIAYSNATVGGYVGYLKQFSKIVIGAEADISRTPLKGDDSQYAGEVNAIEMNYIGTVRGRLGYAAGRSLLYATAGFAFSDYSKKDETLGWSKDDELTGWAIGAGVEHAATDKWSVRAEYQYVDLGRVDSLLTDGGAYYYHRALGVDVQSVRFGVSYHF